MVFTEFRFLGFFAIAFGVHWLLRSNAWRKNWLLACSYVFYGAWDARFLALILFSTVFDFAVGRALGRTRGERARKGWIVASCIVNLGLLAVFKYHGFFIESAVALAHTLGIDATAPQLEIVLPVGISFFTFQSMSYTIDVYRRQLAPISSLRDFMLFVAFFPQLVAGPIVRAVDFLPQLGTPRRWSDVRVRWCVTLFLIGFFKKACVSDNVSGLVDAYFKDPAAHGALAAWTAVPMYAVQIYCDFSGYSDMALATAGLLGFELRINFDFPYLAGDIRDFWRRWHMSLSTWLRDYLYIPLGGSRGSKLYAYRNLMLTMLLGGLWHGAQWTFVIWGALHGAALIAHREWERVAGRRGLRMPRALGLALTFWWVCVAWIFFRVEKGDLGAAWTALRSFVLLESPGSLAWGWSPLAVFAALAAVHVLSSKLSLERVERAPAWGYAVGAGAACAVLLAFSNNTVKPFIYFQF